MASPQTLDNPEKSDLEKLRERVREDFPYWAENFAKIVTKQGDLIPLQLKTGQAELDALLEQQRSEGKPMRGIILKARQLGFSTYAQAKFVHRCTLRERYNATTVAHDRETGAKLYQMAETIYANLPEDSELKPKIGSWRRGRGLHFAGEGLWHQGNVYPDSRYLVDTAGEFEAGRGGTYRGMHLSELAFWPQIIQKYAALMQAVPDDPESLVLAESTANGYNAFKDLWDDAEAGRSGFIAFFWPWWKDEEYALPFMNEAEREAFQVGDPGNPYAEREPELIEQFDLSLEQLNWRRRTIATKLGGDIRLFDQEYPTTAEDAFIATGQKVFDSYRVAQLLVRVDLTDPRQPTEEAPGPQIGDFKADRMRREMNRVGDEIDVPETALFRPRERGVTNPEAPFRLWLPPTDDEERQRPEGEFIVAVDASGGRTEETKDPDYHAIQVIDHKTREQVAEYRSRIDPDLLTMRVLLTALYFNNAWVGVERTGGWGGPILRTLRFDFHYPYVYRSRRVGSTTERTEPRLGWDTNVKTKPILVAGMAELLRIEEDGVKSRALADEIRTYTRDEKGATGAEPGKYDDLLMAYMIAQELAREIPLREADEDRTVEEAPYSVAVQRLSGYDPRMR